MRLELTDPTRGESSPKRCWSRTNIGEATPEVLSALCWTLWRDFGELANRQAWYDMGLIGAADVVVSGDPEQMAINCFYGRQALNLDALREVIALAPGGSADGFERDTLGYVRPGAPPVRASRRRYPVMAVKAPIAMLNQRRRIGPLHDRHLRWWRDEVLGERPTPPGQGQPLQGLPSAQRLLADSGRRFAEAMRLHLYARATLMPATQGALSALAAAVGGPDLAGRVLGGFGATGETEIADDLWRLSRGTLDRAGFLRRHGYHGPSEGNPISRSWGEDFAPVEALAKAYAGRPDTDDPSARAAVAMAEHRVPPHLRRAARRGAGELRRGGRVPPGPPRRVPGPRPATDLVRAPGADAARRRRHGRRAGR